MVGSIARIVRRGRSDVIDDLMKLAEGDVDLLQEAIRKAAGDADTADLEKVVAYVVQRRRWSRRSMRCGTVETGAASLDNPLTRH